MDMDSTLGGYVGAEAILAAQDIPEADVDAPEWGGRVRVRGLTMGEVLGIREAAGDNERQVIVMTLAAAFVRPSLNQAQAEALLGKSGQVAQRVLVAINQLNGIGQGGPEVAAAQRAFPGEAGTPPGTDPGEAAGQD